MESTLTGTFTSKKHTKKVLEVGGKDFLGYRGKTRLSKDRFFEQREEQILINNHSWSKRKEFSLILPRQEMFQCSTDPFPIYEYIYTSHHYDMISDILNNRNGIASYSASGYGREDELLQCLTPEPDGIDKATSSGTDMREILDEFEINIIEQGRSENEVDLTNHFQCTNSGEDNSNIVNPCTQPMEQEVISSNKSGLNNTHNVGEPHYAVAAYNQVQQRNTFSVIGPNSIFHQQHLQGPGQPPSSIDIVQYQNLPPYQSVHNEMPPSYGTVQNETQSSYQIYHVY